MVISVYGIVPTLTFLFYMYMSYLHVCLCMMCMQCPWQSEELELYVVVSHHVGAGHKPDLLITELTLQPPHFLFYFVLGIGYL